VQADLLERHGEYGVDALLEGLVPMASGGTIFSVLAAVHWRLGRRRLAVADLVAALTLLGSFGLYLHTTRRGKFQVWAEILAGLHLRGDERVLDMGCGRGAVLAMVAKLLSRGHAVGVDLWTSDQSGNRPEATQRNLIMEGVADRCELRTGDMLALPFDDNTFDLVIGHAVIHHIPDVELAFREMLRVLKPGGRFVICGEPTRYGDQVARRLSRFTWWATTNVTKLPALSEWRRPQAELDESSRAAALEAVVDLHTFDPDTLARMASRAGAVDVRTVTEELLAAWVGWPIRTFEAAVPEQKLGFGWRMFAYKSWLQLSKVDKVLSAVVPDELYYNVSITGTAPSAQ